jgi:hypothetical protein
MEIAVYHADGTLRLRGPVLAVTQRGEALRGSEWALQGLELVIHPALYEGVRRADGSIGRLWAPAPTELATIDHARFPYALALGLILPIRWRWDTADGLDHLTLTGEKLLDTAGIPCPRTTPGGRGRRSTATSPSFSAWAGSGSPAGTRTRREPARGAATSTHRSGSATAWSTGSRRPSCPWRRPADGRRAAHLASGPGWTQAQAAKDAGGQRADHPGRRSTPDEPLGRAILAGLDQYASRNPADPTALPQ